MRPKTLSATSIKAAVCPARFKAEFIDYARGEQNDAAKRGSACHEALEQFVQTNYLDKVPGMNTLDYMRACFEVGYEKIFASVDFTTEAFDDGWEMVRNWFLRQNETMSGRIVQSVEIKKRYLLTLADGTSIPITYIMDRVDIIEGTDQIVVVDYKSNRNAMGSEELSRNIQAQLYALIMQIQYPEAKRIRVEFDLLRHGIVGTTFTSADNAKTWNWLHGEVARIIWIDEEVAKNTRVLNSECNYCVLKTTCPDLRKNIDAGGVFSMGPTELVDAWVQLDGVSKGSFAALKEIKAMINSLLANTGDEPNPLKGTTHEAYSTTGSRRVVDPDRVGAVVDPDILADYVKPAAMTVKSFEEMMKDPRIKPEQRVELFASVEKKFNEPSIKLAPIVQ